MQIKKIFLACSSELKDDRQQFEIFINRKNKEWVAKGVFLELVMWEDFLEALSQTRLQDEYDSAVRDSDVFVMLFSTKVGKYTEEEFQAAFGQFQSTKKPAIFTYFKDAQVSLGSIEESDLMSMFAFKRKLLALGHFMTVYRNIDELKFSFDQQLDKLAANSFIELQGADNAAMAPQTRGGLPFLAYGAWTLRNAVDDSGLDWSNSVLKFSSQKPIPEGLALRGEFTWRLNNEVLGTEVVSGTFIAATREITFEGETVSNPGRLAVGSYSAYLSADGRELTNGRWGSSSLQGDAGTPGLWEATR